MSYILGWQTMRVGQNSNGGLHYGKRVVHRVIQRISATMQYKNAEYSGEVTFNGALKWRDEWLACSWNNFVSHCCWRAKD